MLAKIVTKKGIREIFIIGKIHTIRGYCYFKYNHSHYSWNKDYRFTELSTGFSLPINLNTWKKVEEFIKSLPKEEIEAAFKKAIISF